MLAAVAAPSTAAHAAVAPPKYPKYLVGTAVRSINPSQAEIDGGKVYLGGYGFAANAITGDRHATGILGEGASVRAFAISDAVGNGFAVADMELQGWFTATKDGPLGIVDMRRAVEKRTGGELKAEQVVVQSDHSHAGLDGLGVWGGLPLSTRQRIFDRTVDSIVSAWKDRKKIQRLVYGTADGRDLLSNQFSWDPDNQAVDSDVRVLQAQDQYKHPIATLLNFSAHATVLGSSNTKVSGDWVQRTNPMLERAIGGSVVTMVGTLGRTQPADRGCSQEGVKRDSDEDYLCTLDDYSARVVARTKLALSNAKPIPGDPVVVAKSYLIQDPATNPVLLGLMAAGDPIGAPLVRAQTPPWLTGNVLGTVTGTARIGDVIISSGPGEMYPQLPLKVREIVGAKARGFMTAGLAGDQLGYIIGPAPESYPKPMCASLLDSKVCQGEYPTDPADVPDTIQPIGNDNYFFNVSHTLGERVTCSLLRGAGEVLGEDFRSKYEKCPLFANDTLFASGADTVEYLPPGTPVRSHRAHR